MPCTKLSLVYLYHCFNTRQSENKKNFNSVQFRFKLKFFFRVRRLCPNFHTDITDGNFGNTFTKNLHLSLPQLVSLWQWLSSSPGQ